MRQFYYLFSDRNFSTVSRILSWSHYSELLSIKDKNEVEYYLNESLNNNYSIRQLREMIKSKEYYRLPESTRNKLITNTKLELKDTIKDPIIIILIKILLMKMFLKTKNINTYLFHYKDSLTDIEHNFIMNSIKYNWIKRRSVYNEIKNTYKCFY